MKRNIVLVLFLAWTSFFGCEKHPKEKGIELPRVIEKTITTEAENNADRESFSQIKEYYKNDYYTDLDRQIRQFLDYRKNSIYKDSVEKIRILTNSNRDKLSIIRDSLSRSAKLYFDFMNLPRLDSITGVDYNVNAHSYKVDFIPFDKTVFKSFAEYSWYLSDQSSSEYINIAICHYVDCEQSIYLYLLDNGFNILDKVELFHSGCRTVASNFRFGGYIINELKDDIGSYFINDSTFNKINRTYFSLLDTISKKEKIEIGFEQITKYSIESGGRFRIIQNDGFKKEYVEPYYKAPI